MRRSIAKTLPGVVITVVDGLLLLVTMSDTLGLGTARGVKLFVGPAVR